MCLRPELCECELVATGGCAGLDGALGSLARGNPHLCFHVLLQCEARKTVCYNSHTIIGLGITDELDVADAVAECSANFADSTNSHDVLSRVKWVSSKVGSPHPDFSTKNTVFE